MYKILRSILFMMDAERAHYFSMNSLKWLCRFPVIRKIIALFFKPMDKPRDVLGLAFKNPVGLAAG
ncbi:MAG TPA: dihydroorotate dehydrogenase (quinone), partial [Ferruginibacter sp.]|nr:dihydroorotate dehydrogenase (quinone) [Ferruginibacter sp.]